MTVAFYMNCVSTHQLPLAREVVKLVGAENFRYIDAGLGGQANQTIGYVENWITSDKSWLDTADLVLTGLRDLETIERRADKGLKTYYYSERWFKPIRGLPGSLRMLVPSYRKMVKRFVKWANTDPNARVLAIGPWAKKDFLKMGIKLDKIVDWGYYVKPSDALPAQSSRPHKPLRLLWAGRRLRLKRVEDIERAVSELARLKRVELTELSGVTPDEVRKAMREHDTFIMSSNGYEGWGAVVSEALEEGMNVIGTYEAGASAAMLPQERLYHAGDVKALARLLEAECRGALPPCSIGEWTAKAAAKRLIGLYDSYMLI